MTRLPEPDPRVVKELAAAGADRDERTKALVGLYNGGTTIRQLMVSWEVAYDRPISYSTMRHKLTGAGVTLRVRGRVREGGPLLHGDVRKYQQEKCGCAKCRAANSQKAREYRAKIRARPQS